MGQPVTAEIEKVVGAEELRFLAAEARKVGATRYAEAYELLAARLDKLSQAELRRKDGE